MGDKISKFRESHTRITLTIFTITVVFAYGMSSFSGFLLHGESPYGAVISMVLMSGLAIVLMTAHDKNHYEWRST